MPYRTIIFDLDGTLLNTLDDLAASTNAALRTHDLSPRTTDEVRSFVGNGIRNLIRLAVPEGSSEQLVQTVHATFDEHYAQHSLDRTAPYPGVIALVRRLRTSGYRCCVVSNKGDYAVQPLIEHFFPGLFDVVCGEREQDGIRRKPWPDTVLACMRALESTPDECVYVGDSEVDVQTAENAGIPCILVTWGFRDEDYLRTFGDPTFAHDIDELEHALREG